MDNIINADGADADLKVGADKIAREIFGGAGNPRQVYRMAEAGGWPIFKVQGKVAARRSVMLAEIARREREATGTVEAA